MFLRAESSRRATSGTGGADGDGAQVPAVPNVRGDFDELLGNGPVFRTKINGYDRLEVDNYTAWAEGELVALRRQMDHLLSRFGAASAELEISRRLLAEAPPGREAFPVSKRVQEMLRLAEDEAAALTEAGAHEAERIVAEARTEADARLRKAHEIKEAAIASADEILEDARRERAAAAAAMERARAEAAEILRQAAVERDRLAAEGTREREEAVAAADAHLASVRAGVDDLRRQRDETRGSLHVLNDRIGEALQALAAVVPEDLSGTNIAVEGMNRDDDLTGRDGVVISVAGRPTAVSS
jgi:cell division septum initiation protein DivIVA